MTKEQINSLQTYKMFENDTETYVNREDVLRCADDSTTFKDELKTLVAKRLDEINHFISGCDSPFGYVQVMTVQGYLSEIRNTLGIEDKEE